MTHDGLRVERAYAKVNLLLRILAREASGYHGIETLFQTLALHDLVTVRAGGADRTLHCDGPTMPAEGLGPTTQNLAWRAAEAFMRATGWDAGWSISIDKQIPVGGGLGGGSADAAAVLRALNALAPQPLPMGELLTIAGTLGADVPVLVLGAPLAWGWGRGDRLLVLPPLPPVPVHLVTFAEGVATAAAYGAVAAQRTTAGSGTSHGGTKHGGAVAYGATAFGSWESVAALAANDFEAVVPGLHAGVASVLPVLRAAAADARDHGVPAIGMLSGSGATCYLLGTDLPAGMASALTAGRVVSTETRATTF